MPEPLVAMGADVVDELSAPSAQRTHEPRARHHYVAWAATVTIIAAVVVGLVFFRPFDRTTAAPIPLAETYVAVLPFDNLSDNPDYAYVTDGISADIQASLVRNRSPFRVADLSTGFRFRGTDKRPANVRSRISATHVFDGSVKRDGDQVRVVVQLIEIGQGRVVWAESFERSLDQVLDIQQSVVRWTAEVFQAGVPNMTATSPQPPMAVEHYLRAMQMLGQGIEDPRLAARAVSELEAAMQTAPDFPAARAALEQANRSRIPGAPAAPAGGTP
jgi:TolB-like protein